MKRVALCADEESLLHPEILGLEGESFEAQAWLSVHNLAYQMRFDLNACDDVDEVWVVSSDDMAAINLAAALKKDRPLRHVLLFSNDCNGSVKSRATHAGLDGVADCGELPRIYAQRKNAHRDNLAGDTEEESCTVPAIEAESSPSLEGMLVARPAMGSDSKGFVLPVVSGSGGVGKTTVCVTLGILAQRLGLRSVIVDLDLQFGDVKEALAEEDALAVDAIVAMPHLLGKALADQKAPVVLAAPLRVEQAEALLPHVDSLIESLRGSFDLVVVDTGCFWAEHHIQLLEHCDKALFIVDQRPSALRSCKKALDLCTHCGVAASPFVVGVNRCSKNGLFTSIDASCALYGLPAVELKDGGSEIEALMAAGCANELPFTKNLFVDSVEAALRELVPAAKEIEPAEKTGPARRPWFQFGKKPHRDG